MTTLPWATASRLMATFHDDIRAFVLGSIRTTPQTRRALEAKGAIELLIVFGNWRRRFVEPVRRKVHRSREFMESRFHRDPRYAGEIAALVAKIQDGRSIEPHLSTRVNDAYVVRDPSKPKKLSARQDVDMLLNDWGVHHLHLSSQPWRDGFNARTKLLLMAGFTRTDAYLLDIMDHDQWSNDQIVRVLVREWDGAGFVGPLNGISPDAINTDQRKGLRDVGVNATVNVDGVAYYGTGYTSDGSNSAAVMEAMQVHRRLEWFAKEVEADPGFLTRTLLQSGVKTVADPDLHFHVSAGGWGVYEAKSRTFLTLP